MTIKSGYYKHYKGATYYVYGVFKHTETSEDMVAYHEMQEWDNNGTAPIEPLKRWVRPLSMFVETITVGNKQIPRFSRIDDIVKEISNK
jgi:hypothetical protein